MTEDPRTGTHIHDPMLMHAEPDRRERWLWAGVAVCILIIAGISIARAAETPGKYEIALHYAGKDYDAVQRTHMTLATYDSRTECEVMIVRVRVEVKGARLVCRQVGLERVK